MWRERLPLRSVEDQRVPFINLGSDSLTLSLGSAVIIDNQFKARIDGELVNDRTVYVFSLINIMAPAEAMASNIHMLTVSVCIGLSKVERLESCPIPVDDWYLLVSVVSCLWRACASKL